MIKGKFWIMCMCLLLAVVTARGQQSTLRLGESSYDFGAIREVDGKVSHRFTFTNTGNTPFVIERVSTSCGCTTPSYSREPILPGKTGSITITFDPADRPGHFRKEVILLSNNLKNRNTITITGSVEAAPRLIEEDYPVDLGEGLRAREAQLSFGYVARGSEKTMVIEFYNNGKKPIRLGTLTEHKTPYFSLKFSAIELAPQQRCLLNATFALEKADVWGMLNEPFRVTIDGKSAAIPFAATAIATEAFGTLTPEQQAKVPAANLNSQYFHAGEVKPGASITHNFTLTNEGKSLLVVRHVAAASGMTTNLKAGTSLRPGESLTFTVTLRTPNQNNLKAVGSITLILNDPRRPMREIRLAANTLK